MSAHFLGLRTAGYRVRDLAAAKTWYATALGVDPYFDEPYYVGFNVGGYELGLMPFDSPVDAGGEAVVDARADTGTAYWGVTDADASYARLIALGARDHEPIQDVGEGIRVGSVYDPFGNVLGVIFNPHFTLP